MKHNLSITSGVILTISIEKWGKFKIFCRIYNKNSAIAICSPRCSNNYYTKIENTHNSRYSDWTMTISICKRRISPHFQISPLPRYKIWFVSYAINRVYDWPVSTFSSLHDSLRSHFLQKRNAARHTSGKVFDFPAAVFQVENWIIRFETFPLTINGLRMDQEKRGYHSILQLQIWLW